MAYEIKDNSGSLFKNDRKEKETHPDYTGTVRIAGVDYWQSAWKKTDKNGNTYLSFSFKPKQANGHAPVSGGDYRAPHHTQADLDDDVPF